MSILFSYRDNRDQPEAPVHGQFPEDWEEGGTNFCGVCADLARRYGATYRHCVAVYHGINLDEKTAEAQFNIWFSNQQVPSSYDWREEVQKLFRLNSLKRLFAGKEK